MSDVPVEKAAKLILAGDAPEALHTGTLQLGLEETKRPVTKLPRQLSCYSLSLAGQPIVTLPQGLQVEFKLDLTDCHQLTELPANLKVSTLVLTNCSQLT